MNLTPQQVQALDRGDAVPVMMDGRDCVIVRRDIYEHAREDDGDVLAMQEYLVDLAAEDWEDVANYEQP